MMLQKLLRGTGIFALLLASAAASQAGTTVWAFNASLGNPHIQAYDLATGNNLADFEAPHNDARRGRANGRGIAVVGNTIYYSLADTPNVYKTDAVTHADLGIAFATVLTPGINSLSWDGASLWMLASHPNDPNAPADDKVYQYSPAGQLLQTLTLARPQNSNLARDGFEVLPDGRFIANRGSVPYDIYDAAGKMQKSVFITSTARTTGIACDGANYIISVPSFTEAGGGGLATYDANGQFVRLIALPVALIPFGIVDLAVDRAATPPPAAAPPAIAQGQVLNGASFEPGIVPNSFMTIKGTNLAPTTVDWTNFIGPNGELPISLAGVKVSVGGKPAYVNAVSPGQINVLAPDVGFGPVQVTVTTDVGTSAAATANSQQYGPAFFLWSNTYAVATRPDFSIAVKNGTFSAATVPAKPGDVIILWGTGFGPTNPVAPVGVKVPFGTLYLTASPVTVTIGNTPVQVFGAALAAPYAGLYQVNLKIPDNMPDGDWPIVATINGVSSPASTLLTVLR